MTSWRGRMTERAGRTEDPVPFGRGDGGRWLVEEVRKRRGTSQSIDVVSSQASELLLDRIGHVVHHTCFKRAKIAKLDGFFLLLAHPELQD